MINKQSLILTVIIVVGFVVFLLCLQPMSCGIVYDLKEGKQLAALPCVNGYAMQLISSGRPFLQTNLALTRVAENGNDMFVDVLDRNGERIETLEGIPNTWGNDCAITDNGKMLRYGLKSSEGAAVSFRFLELEGKNIRSGIEVSSTLEPRFQNIGGDLFATIMKHGFPKTNILSVIDVATGAIVDYPGPVATGCARFHMKTSPSRKYLAVRWNELEVALFDIPEMKLVTKITIDEKYFRSPTIYPQFDLEWETDDRFIVWTCDLSTASVILRYTMDNIEQPEVTNVRGLFGDRRYYIEEISGDMVVLRCSGNSRSIIDGIWDGVWHYNLQDGRLMKITEFAYGTHLIDQDTLFLFNATPRNWFWDGISTYLANKLLR